MSRQLKTKFTIATLSAMIMLLLNAQAAQAATVGSTQVNSSQHEPLSASINVNNIDANNFSASVAGRSVYQQMDMSMDVPVNVQFVKTSNTSGKLILTSSEPVVEPFADVVLLLNENGEQQSLPKTLLLPLGSRTTAPAATAQVAQPTQSQTAATTPPASQRTVMVGDATNQNLPVVSATPSKSNSLDVLNSLPPVMLEDGSNSNNTLNSSATSISETRTVSPVSAQSGRNNSQSNATQSGNNNDNAVASTSVIDSTPIIDTTPIINTQAFNNTTNTGSGSSSNIITTNNNADKANTNSSSINNNTPLIATGDTDRQTEILSTEITRNYKLPNGEVKVVSVDENNQSNSTPSFVANNSSESDANSSDTGNFEPLKPAPAFIPSATGFEENMIEAAIVRTSRSDPDADVVNVNTPDTVPKPNGSEPSEALQAQTSTSESDSETQSSPSTPKTDIGLSDVTYTVQRNDNLWTIANQIARNNRVDVTTVMNQIQSHNQSAFINGDPNLLKANARLNIPDYDVIPSRLGIRAAMSAQQASRSSSSSSSSNSRPAASRPSSSNTQARNPSSQRSTSQAIPRPSVTLITPGNSGSATGNNTRASGGAQGSGLSSALAARVRATRQQTADEARRVASLNSQLSDYTRKLQLQNQRLSDLEARLRELREQ